MEANYPNETDFIVERIKKINEIKKCLLKSKNVSVVGYPSTGKKIMIKQLKETLSQCPEFDRCVFVQISTTTFNNYLYFFKSLIDGAYNTIDKDELISDEVKLSYEKLNLKKLKLSDVEWGDFIIQMEDFFASIKNGNRRIIYLLQDFDYIREFFKKDNIPQYNSLAEFSFKHSVLFVAFSRKEIRLIEKKYLGGSPFPFSSTFAYPVVTNGYFSDDEVGNFYDKFNLYGYSLNEQIRYLIEYYAGNHPKILSQIGVFVVENYSEIANRLNEDIVEYCERIALDCIEELLLSLDSLEEKDLYVNLCLNQEKSSASNIELVNKFISHRLIKKTSDNTYRAYSGYFQDYLMRQRKEVDSAIIKIKPYEVYLSCADADIAFYKKLESTLQTAAEHKKVPVLLNSRHTIDVGEVTEQVFKMIDTADRIYIVCSTEYFSDHATELYHIKEYKSKYVPIRFRYYNLEMVGLDDVVCFPKSKKILNDLPPDDQDREIAEIVNEIIKYAQSR